MDIRALLHSLNTYYTLEGNVIRGTTLRGTRDTSRANRPGTSARSFMGSSQTVHRLFHTPPKVGGNAMPKVDCPMPSWSPMACFAHVRRLGSQLLRTPIPPHTTCSGPREPGIAAASTARRGRFERPRRALAPRLPPPPELRGACGRAAHAHRDGVRAAAPPERHRGAARPPPECAGVRAGEGL